MSDTVKTKSNLWFGFKGKDENTEETGTRLKGKLGKSLVPVIIIAVVLFVVAVSPIIYSFNFTAKYNNYKDRMQESFLYGIKNDSITCEMDGTKYIVNDSVASSLHSAILGNGMGKVVKTMPDTKQKIVIEFGDGSVLKFMPLSQEKTGDKDKIESFIYYKDSKGTYMYESDKTDYSGLENMISSLKSE
jgi:hypothetical protein